MSWFVHAACWASAFCALSVSAGCAHADAVRAEEVGARYLECPPSEIVSSRLERDNPRFGAEYTLWDIECRDTEQLSSVKVWCDRSGCRPVIHERRTTRDLL
jgi:hypothetical protein